MVEFDPGPSKSIANHLAALPSYAPHRNLFWYDWGPVFYRGRLNGTARFLGIASDPGPTERVVGRRAVVVADVRALADVELFLRFVGCNQRSEDRDHHHPNDDDHGDHRQPVADQPLAGLRPEVALLRHWREQRQDVCARLSHG